MLPPHRSLDYPGIGPEHSFLKDVGRAEYFAVTDEEALEGFQLLSKWVQGQGGGPAGGLTGGWGGATGVGSEWQGICGTPGSSCCCSRSSTMAAAGGW